MIQLFREVFQTKRDIKEGLIEFAAISFIAVSVFAGILSIGAMFGK